MPAPPHGLLQVSTLVETIQLRIRPSWVRILLELPMENWHAQNHGSA